MPEELMIKLYMIVHVMVAGMICSIPAKADPVKPDTAEWMQYESVEERDFDVSVGIRYGRRPNGKVIVEAASMAVGEGADLRKWKVVDIKLVADGRYLRGEEDERIYATSRSMFRAPAAAVFTAIGAAYGIYADECSSGGTCPVSGGPAAVEGERSGLQRGIDTAGMAAGMGLLASQAKGEITGLKAGFDLTPEQAEGLEGVKVTVEHEGTGRKQRVRIPLEGVPGDLFRDLAAEHEGLEHKGGVRKGGTFFTGPIREKPSGKEPGPKKEGEDGKKFPLPYRQATEEPSAGYVAEGEAARPGRRGRKERRKGLPGIEKLPGQGSSGEQPPTGQ